MTGLWTDFVASWDLFGQSYLTGLLIAGVLGACGVVTLAQRQVFLGVATAQSSSFGIALALWLASIDMVRDHHELHGAPLLFGVGFALLASLVTTWARGVSHGAAAVAAWIFVAASAGSVLLMSRSPHGMEEVERLMFSTLIGADEHDVWKFGVSAVLLAAVLGLFASRLLLVVTDRATARALGLPVRRTEWTVSVVLGLAIGLAMHSSGTLFTFSSLALPALAARQVCRTMRAMLWVAPVLAVGVTLLGFVLANGWDHPPGQMAAAVQAAVVALGWPLGGLLAALRSRRDRSR
jgi:ABC-type Mn2+/Zn2+ transport system permease subunit